MNSSGRTGQIHSSSPFSSHNSSMPSAPPSSSPTPVTTASHSFPMSNSLFPLPLLSCPRKTSSATSRRSAQSHSRAVMIYRITNVCVRATANAAWILPRQPCRPMRWALRRLLAINKSSTIFLGVDRTMRTGQAAPESQPVLKRTE